MRCCLLQPPYRLLWMTVLALFLPRFALAHPHAWIDTRTILQFNSDHQLESLKSTWVFDELYSAWAVNGLDVNKDGKYSTDELAQVAKGNLTELKEWGYFTVLKVDDKRVPLEPPETGYTMQYQDGRLSMTFTLPLAKPVDPRLAAVKFSIFDPSFYIQITPAREDPVRLVGSVPGNCVARVGDILNLTKQPYIPDMLIATLDIDPGQPEQGPGAQFAEWVRLTCSKQP
jgi:ABC-type uncharacterized transport system substrate-binding protein